jgi:hypothetical protein
MRPLGVKKSESVDAAVRRRRARSDSPYHESGARAGVGSAVLCAPFGRIFVLLRPARLEPLQGEAGDFAGVLQIEFVFDVCPVRFHRLWAEMQ